MFIFRVFSKSSAQVNKIYFDLRNSKKYPEKNELFLLTTHLAMMDEKTIVNFSYIFAANYKPRSGFEEYYWVLEKELASRLHTFNINSFTRVVKNFQYSYRQNYNKISKELLASLINKADTISGISAELVEALSKLSGQFKANQLNYESVFKRYMKDCSLRMMNKNELISLLQIYMRLYLSDPQVFRSSQDELIPLVLQELNKNSFSLAEEEEFEVLKSLVLVKFEDETELRKLESKVLSNLHKLSHKNFSQLLNAYANRFLHDYHYWVNSACVKFYEELMSRFCSMPVMYLNQCLISYKLAALVNGMVCDEKVKEKVFEFLARFDCKIEKWEKSNTILAILSFCNVTGLFRDSSICTRILEILGTEISDMQSLLLLKLAHEFSRFEQVPSDFWNFFSGKIPEIIKTTEKGSYLYAIHLNLSLQNPSAYDIIKPAISPYLDVLKSDWNKQRSQDLELSKPSKVHNIVESIIDSIKIPYKVEYYDEYYIDIAIPHKRLAYEILGPGHYIFPSGVLNGQTLNKKRNLEGLGWIWIEVPFFKLRASEKFLSNLIKSTIPLD